MVDAGQKQHIGIQRDKPRDDGLDLRVGLGAQQILDQKPRPLTREIDIPSGNSQRIGAEGACKRRPE